MLRVPVSVFMIPYPMREVIVPLLQYPEAVPIHTPGNDSMLRAYESMGQQK